MRSAPRKTSYNVRDIKMRIYVSICLLMTLGACGSAQSTEKKTIAKEDRSTKITKPSAEQSEVEEPASQGPSVAVGEAPIKIPNSVLYQGYILGGLPNKKQIDQAIESEIETAMSLMGRDEPGISEIGPYAASQGFRYIRFTIAGPKDLTEAMAWEFASTLPLLDKPGIVHSAKGQRVAAIFALKAYFVDEVNAEEALAIGQALGMGEFEGHVRELLELPPE
jgi:protein tyrosine phosphatase (PTP) superfamily phosphohydrolase (DUF442 family)